MSYHFDELKKLLLAHTKRAYIVGGAARDLHMNKIPKDFDIEVYDICPEKFDILAKSWGFCGVGKSFFVYKYKDFDISLPRTESKISHSHAGFSVRYCNDEKLASKRRDFTCNSIMINIFNNNIIDFWGGIDDIKKKNIRLINEKKFAEDALRVLRGIRFAASFGFVIENNTLKIMQKMDLNQISKTRIFWELEKIFNSQYPELGLIYMHKTHALKYIFDIEVKFEKILEIAKIMRYFYNNSSEFLRVYIFLYVLLNELNLDIKQTLIKLQAPKHFLKILTNNPYKKTPLTQKELLMLSLHRPLKEYVCMCQKNMQEYAKKMNIYDNKYNGEILVSEVIKDGFSGKNIQKEILKRKIQKINLTCKDIDG